MISLKKDTLLGLFGWSGGSNGFRVFVSLLVGFRHEGLLRLRFGILL